MRQQVEFSSLPDDALRVYLLLQDIEVRGTRSKMTIKEASLRTGVPTERVPPALDVLVNRGVLVLSEGTKMTYSLTREDGVSIELQFVNSRKNEDAGWEELINENKQLRRQLEDLGEITCGLPDVLPEAPASVFRVAESVIQRGMTYEEVFHLTELIVRYGTKRVITALNDSKKAKQPLRSAYIMLRRGRFGKGKETNTSVPEPVDYPSLDTFDPWKGGNDDN